LKEPNLWHIGEMREECGTQNVNENAPRQEGDAPQRACIRRERGRKNRSPRWAKQETPAEERGEWHIYGRRLGL